MSTSYPFRDVELRDLDPPPFVDFVLLTAVKIEFDEMLSRMTPRSGKKFEHVYDRANSYVLGRCGLYTCVLVQCDPGSQDVGGSAIVARDAIRCWRPSGLIVLGIGFGGSRKKRQLGDVIVATHLVPYDLERLGEVDNVSRSSQPRASRILLKRLKTLGWTWTPKATRSSPKRPKPRAPEFAPFLSGAKLLDNSARKKELFTQHRKAAGGDMEGTGAETAAAVEGVEWILVKALCDWGERKTNKYHALAARNACDLVQTLLQRRGLERAQFKRAPEPSDAELTHSRSSEQFREISRDLHTADRARKAAIREVFDFVQLHAKHSGRQPTLPKRLKGRFQALEAARTAAIEEWLNVYESAAAQFLSDLVPRAAFLRSFGQNYRDLIEDVEEHTPLLVPRDKSDFEGIWAVYDEAVKFRRRPTARRP